MSLFPGGKFFKVFYDGADAPMPAGMALTIDFSLNGLDFIALNGGSWATFSPAISLLIACETQVQVDRLWGGLFEDGELMQCDWMDHR